MPSVSGGGFINVEVQFEGQQALIGKFATFGQRIQTMRPAWEDVGNLLLRDFAYQFHDEGDYLGEEVAPDWEELAYSTQQDRARKHFPPAHPILQRTGQLMASVTQRGAAGNIFEVSDNGIRAGTNYRIAEFHQFGTSRMPQRKMIALRYQTRPEIIRVLGDYVRQQAAAAGLPMTGG